MQRLTTLLARLTTWLGLRPGERREALFGFAILLLVIAGHAMLETARDSLFLSDLPVTRLPWAYLTIAALAFLIGRTFSETLARQPRSRTLTVTLLLGAAVDLLFWQLAQDRHPATLFALYVWTGLIASLVTLQFWLQAGDVFDVGRAKRVFAFLGAGGLAGATLGAGAAGIVVAVSSPRTLILGSAMLFATAGVANHWWSHPGGARRPERTPAQLAEDSASLRDDPYLRRLLAVTLLAAVVATGVDYLFKAAVAAHVPRASLPSFLARYQTVVNGCALVFQLLVASRLLQGLGVVSALGILPGAILVGASAAAAVGGLVPALFVKAVDGTMRHSLDRAGNEILYLPLSRALRERFKALTTGIGQRGGQAAASLGILIASATGASHREMAIGLAVLSALWLVTLTGLRGHYVERFRAQLRNFGSGAVGELPPLDLPSLETLIAALSSSDDAEVLAALDMLAAYDKSHLVSPLIVFHPSRTVALRVLELFTGAPHPEVLRFTDRLLQHEDGDVRATVLRLRTAGQPDEPLLRRSLRDPSPAVRCTALVGLVAGGFVDDEEAAATALRETLADVTADACPILASALRDLPARFALVLAGELSRHPDPRFGAEVAKALSTDPSLVFLETLIGLLPHREARAHAREGIVALGDPALERLAVLLDDPRTPPAVRLHLPRSVSRFMTARAAAILTARLGTEADSRVTYKILRGLGRMRSDAPDLPVDDQALLAVAASLLARAVTMLAYRVTLDVLERSALLEPGSAPLLRALLDEKERRAIEAVFRALHIVDPEAGYAIAFRGLATDGAARASGRELLENVLEGPLRRGLLAMTDALPPAACLAAALAFHEPRGASALAALAADETRTVGPAERAVLRDVCERLLADQSDVMHAIAARELRALDLADPPPLARAGGLDAD
jgi:ATP:ADP antiporter, AAA family